MAIVPQPLPKHLPEDERRCFFCYGELSDPAIAWMGSTAMISMHPACTIELAIRLFRDVHEVEKTSHRYVTGPRTLEELRSRLIAEEHRR